MNADRFHFGRSPGATTPLALRAPVRAREIPSRRRTRLLFAAFARLVAGVGLFPGLTSLIARAEAAPFQTHETILPLADGRWNGVVVFDHAAVRFTVDVDSFAPPAAAISVQSDQRRISCPDARAIGNQVVLPLSASGDNRLEGTVLADSFVGYFRLGDGAIGFPFRATRQSELSAERASESDLTGEWIFSFRESTGAVRTITAVIGQGRDKTYAILREADGSRRYLNGKTRDHHLTLSELHNDAPVFDGRLNPMTGYLAGKYRRASGSFVAFTATRKSARPLINLAFN